jgi:TonB-dependent SusC/RagA subfamily outer membrane receptor
MKYKHFISIILCIVFFQNTICLTAQNRLTNGTYKNIYDMLKDVPGLDVTTNGGKAGSIIIRGMSSLKSQQQPLFVIDNSIYNGDIMNLNVQDVDNISVLKDAASLTAYGAQGNAGVIIITTKKGATVIKGPLVENHSESAYTYFIEHNTKLKIIGLDDKTIIEGSIVKQVDTLLVFIKRKKEVTIPLRLIKRVEMLPNED